MTTPELQKPDANTALSARIRRLRKGGRSKAATPSPARMQPPTVPVDPREEALDPALNASRVLETLLEQPQTLSPVRMRHQRETTYRRFLACADGFSALLVTLSAAHLARAAVSWTFVLVPCLAVTIGKVQGLYDRDDMVIRKSTLSEWRSVMQASLLEGIIICTGWGVITVDHYHHFKLLLFLVVGMFLLSLASRMMARSLAMRIAPQERCAIVGDLEDCATFAHTLRQVPGVDMIGVIDDKQFGTSVRDVQEVVERFSLQRVVISPTVPWRNTLAIIRSLKWLGVRVSLMPSVMTVVGGATVADNMGGTVVLGVPAFGMTRSSQLLKRAFDLAGATVAAFIFAMPALLIAICIRLDSPGPVIFRQVRIGQGGLPFTMYKFRSMVRDAEQRKDELHAHNESRNGLFKMASDPRVTRVGRFLRKSYLDELPQLLNVFRGEMSLVGPRPLIQSEDLLLTGADRHRLALPPGMTGPWQLHGPLETSLPELAKLDYLYASNWSIWHDVDILMGTIARVFNRHGH